MIIRHNQKGMTLVELLAAIVISTMILVFLYTIIAQGSSQYKRQTQMNNNIQEIAYAFKIMTEDLRKTSLNGMEIKKIVVDNSTLHANNNIYSYNNEDKSIELNNNLIVSNIKLFRVNETTSTGVNITIETLHGKEYSTLIVLREGD